MSDIALYGLLFGSALLGLGPFLLLMMSGTMRLVGLTVLLMMVAAAHADLGEPRL